MDQPLMSYREWLEFEGFDSFSWGYMESYYDYVRQNRPNRLGREAHKFPEPPPPDEAPYASASPVTVRDLRGVVDVVTYMKRAEAFLFLMDPSARGRC